MCLACLACACHHPQAVNSHRGGEKTDKFRFGQQREVDKMTLGKLHHWQPGSDWRQQTLRRQENWKMAFTRIRIDNEEDPSWQQLGAKAVREQRQEGCSELIVFLGHFKVAWRQPSQGWQLAGRVWCDHLSLLSRIVNVKVPICLSPLSLLPQSDNIKTVHHCLPTSQTTGI